MHVLELGLTQFGERARKAVVDGSIGKSERVSR